MKGEATKPGRPCRLAALFSHPIQYFAPLFRRLAAQPGIDLTVFYCSRQSAAPRLDPGFGQVVQWDIPLLEGYRYRFLHNWYRSDLVGGFFSLVNPGIVGEILQGGWDVLWLHGYMHLTHWLALLAAKFAGVPVLSRGESNLLDPRPIRRLIIKNLLLRLWLSQVNGALYIGSHNRDFYRHYGMPEEKLFFTPYTVDNDFFKKEAARLHTRRSALRRKFGVKDERPLILFCGKLIPKKQPLLLLKAYASVRRNKACALLYAGDGVLRKDLEEKVSREEIKDVKITGFLNQSEISKVYFAADFLVLPSAWGETWGLVLNEGMNFGLPVVTSDRVGAAVDLVREGKNGFIVPNQDVDALAAALAQLVEDADLRFRFGQQSREIIEDWGLDETVAGIANAIQRF